MSKIIREPLLRWRAVVLKKETAWTIYSRCDGRTVFVVRIAPTVELGDHREAFGFVLDVASKFPFWLERFSKTHICQ
jgi:hypothetical protein